MNINVVLHETDFVIQNTNSVQRVKQLAEVFTAYAEGEKSALAPALPSI